MNDVIKNSMYITVKTVTRYTAKCCDCKYEIYAENAENINKAEEIFKTYGWGIDRCGRTLCPDCLEQEFDHE